MANNLFTTVPMRKPGYNYFDFNHDVKLSFRMGELVPTCLVDVVPGDKFHIQVENFLRFAPLISPVMHRINVTTHFFFVPNRILWDEWEDYITGESSVAPPTIDGLSGIDVGDLSDYLGCPVNTTNSFNVSAFPFAAYALIWDEYYRDQNLQDEVFTPLVSGNNSANYGDLQAARPRSRAWMHDYFTSCLPFAQKGDDVLLPLGTFSDVDVVLDIQPTPNAGFQMRAADGSLIEGVSTLQSSDNPDGQLRGNNPIEAAYIDPSGNLKAQTSDLEAQAADINSVRRAFALQKWLEKDARGGTRYIENILAHFGVRSSDARLQRPEYIGGSFQRMTISEVLSTAQTIDSTEAIVNPVGQMAGHGVSYGNGDRFTYYAEEHGWILGLINVQPVTGYQQGIHRSLSRTDRFDYYWPSFAHIGEQAVLNKEVYVDQAQADQDGTFGYIMRYAEYKYMNSRVAGEFRDTLDFWHLSRKFTAAPALNSAFVTCDPSTRIFAVDADDNDTIYANVFNHMGAYRLMPRFGIPSI